MEAKTVARATKDRARRIYLCCLLECLILFIMENNVLLQTQRLARPLQKSVHSHFICSFNRFRRSRIIAFQMRRRHPAFYRSSTWADTSALPVTSRASLRAVNVHFSGKCPSYKSFAYIAAFEMLYHYSNRRGGNQKGG